MYYHSAVMLLFRPFIRLSIPRSAISPREVCFEAANAITSLLGSYNRLYSLRRTPSFVPHLILTSSIMHLSVNTGPSLRYGGLGSQLQSMRVDSQASKAINQCIIYLTDMARCSLSAAGSLHLIQILAEGGYDAIDGPGEDSTVDGEKSAQPNADSRDFFGPELTDAILRAWDSRTGGFNSDILHIMSYSWTMSCPPFWLCNTRRGWNRPLDRAYLEDIGFGFL